MSSKIIIYDDSCPLCAGYTGAFVKAGFIDAAGRKNFSTITPELLCRINTEKCIDEIPVLDTETGQVWYGIDALLEILGQKIPAVKKIGTVKPVKWLLQKIYKFISFNRKVIVAPRKRAGNFDCTPHFNIPYRLLFIFVFLSFNTVMLFPLHQFVISNSLFGSTGLLQLQTAHACLVVINIVIALLLKKQAGLEYLGQINMLALLAILLMLPLIAINKYTGLGNAGFNSFYLGALGLFLVAEYARRIKNIELHKTHRSIIAINIICLACFITYLLV